MDTRQLYVNGKSIYPETNYEKDKVPKQILEIRELIREITIKIANELLHNDDIAAWAKQLQKPAYTASEVGADASGSASKALADAKEYANSTYIQATGYTDSAIAALINGAPSTRDTLKEIADAMAENEDVVQALEAAIGTRANEAEFQAHAGNETVHITASEKEKISDLEQQPKWIRDSATGKITGYRFGGADPVFPFSSGGNGTLEVNFSFVPVMNKRNGISSGTGRLTVTIENGAVTASQITGNGYSTTISAESVAYSCSVGSFTITSIKWTPEEITEPSVL